MYNIRLVCEGATDQAVLEAVLYAHLKNPDFRVNRLQPEESRFGGDAGPHGGGWKGVRGWCQSVRDAGGLEAVGALQPEVDLLVIHVDADIVYEREHNVSSPCPPPQDNILAAEAIVKGWLDLDVLPEKALVWVPSMATEAWVLRALFPSLPESASCVAQPVPPECVECLPDPASTLLGRRPKLVERKPRMKQGRRVTELRKKTTAFIEVQPLIAMGWLDLVAMLWSAARLQQGLTQWIPSS